MSISWSKCQRCRWKQRLNRREGNRASSDAMSVHPLHGAVLPESNGTMRNHPPACLGILPLMAFGVFSADPTCVLIGLLKKESFYESRPTTYWSRTIVAVGEAKAGNKPPSWVEKVQSFVGIDPLDHAAAIARLEKAPEAIHVLRGLLKDRNAYVRARAAIALFSLYGVPDQELVPALGEALSVKDPEIRFYAMLALDELGPAVQPVIPALIEALGDQEPWRQTSLYYVPRISQRILFRLGPSAIPSLVKALDNRNPDIRAGAAAALGLIGSDSAPVVQALTKALKDRRIRAEAALALWRIDPDVPRAVPALLQALRDPDPELRAQAAYCIREMSSDAEFAIPALIRRLKDDSPVVQRSAAYALGEIGPLARSAVPALKAMLKDPEIESAASFALRMIEQDYQPVTPEPPPTDSGIEALLQLGKHKAQPGQGLTLKELWQMQEAEALVQGLIEQLEHPAEGNSNSAVAALGQLGPRAKAAIPALMEKLRQARYVDQGRDHLRSVDRQAVLIAIWRINRQPNQVVPHLAEMLKCTYEDLTLTYWAREFAEEISPMAREAVPILEKMVRFWDIDGRIHAARSLGNIGPDARAAIPALVRALKHYNSGVRAAASEALRKIDPHNRYLGQ